MVKYGNNHINYNTKIFKKQDRQTQILKNGEDKMENVIGQRIKSRRKALKITQTYIQENTRISSGNLSCIENGKSLPSAQALIELSRVLKCSTDWILTGKYPEVRGNFLVAETEDEIFMLDSFKRMSDEDKKELLAITKIKNEKRERLSPLKNEQTKIS